MGRGDDEDFQGWKEGKYDNRYDGNFRRAGGKNPYKKSHTGKFLKEVFKRDGFSLRKKRAVQ